MRRYDIYFEVLMLNCQRFPSGWITVTAENEYAARSEAILALVKKYPRSNPKILDIILIEE